MELPDCLQGLKTKYTSADIGKMTLQNVKNYILTFEEGVQEKHVKNIYKGWKSQQTLHTYFGPTTDTS